MTVGSHPSPTAPEVDIKIFLSLPLTTEKIDDYIEERVFENFSKTFGNQGSKCQNWGFGFSHVK